MTLSGSVSGSPFSSHMPLSWVVVGLKTAKNGCPSPRVRQWQPSRHQSQAVTGGVNW